MKEAGFLTALAMVEDGRLAQELGEKTRSLVMELTEQAKHGGMPIGKLKLGLTFKLINGVMHVTAAVDIIAPKPKRPLSIMYAMADGSLTDLNPRQLEMPLTRDVQPAPVRDVAAPEQPGVRDITSARQVQG